jgi:hypothetical protein
MTSISVASDVLTEPSWFLSAAANILSGSERQSNCASIMARVFFRATSKSLADADAIRAAAEPPVSPDCRSSR